MFLAALTAITCLTAPESAPPRTRVAVTPIQVVGELEEHWHRLLKGRLIRRLGKTLVVVEANDECTTPSCYAKAAADADAEFLVAAVVSVTDNDYKVSVRLIDGADGSAIAVGSDGCEVCAVEEVGDLLADQTVILRQKVEAMETAPPILRVRSSPAGALVYVDGELVGKTPVERTIPVGAHELRAEKRGYIAASSSVVAEHGESYAKQLELEPIPRVQRAKPWAWGMVGLGGLGIVAGVTLLVLDGRQYRLRCTGEHVDELGNCRFRYGTQSQGIVFTALGGATAIAGAIILGVARARQPRPRVAATPGGVQVRF